MNESPANNNPTTTTTDSLSFFTLTRKRREGKQEYYKVPVSLTECRSCSEIPEPFLVIQQLHCWLAGWMPVSSTEAITTPVSQLRSPSPLRPGASRAIELMRATKMRGNFHTRAKSSKQCYGIYYYYRTTHCTEREREERRQQEQRADKLARPSCTSQSYTGIEPHTV